jgi:aspartyl-tRNA(Asn)/glutamyl-tRNA(Gln) amidotransferase subunit C
MSSSLTPEEVARIAHLARLALTGDELQLFARQLAGILDYAEQLRGLDTTDVPPTSHPLALVAPLREDEVRPSLPTSDAVRAAPESESRAGLFKVPRVLGA